MYLLSPLIVFLLNKSINFFKNNNLTDHKLLNTYVCVMFWTEKP